MSPLMYFELYASLGMSHSPGSLTRQHTQLLAHLCSHSEKERKKGRLKEAKKERRKEKRKEGKKVFMAWWCMLRFHLHWPCNVDTYLEVAEWWTWPCQVSKAIVIQYGPFPEISLWLRLWVRWSMYAAQRVREPGCSSSSNMLKSMEVLLGS